MTNRPDFERNVAAWLNAAAGQGTPDYLDEIEGRVAIVRQRAWWSSPERWLPMDLTTRASSLNPPRVGRALLIAILLVAIVATAVLLVGSRRRVPPPFGPAGNGAIVYSNSGDIYLSDPSGDPRLVLGGTTVDLGPLFSNDGTRIAFLRQVSDRTFQYMVMDADGTHPTALNHDPLTDPDKWDWSPDGSRLVVMHTVADRRVLSILPTDGSGAIRRLDVGGLEPDSPAWQPPAGDEIVFLGNTDRGSAGALFAIRPDGTGLRALTPNIAGRDSEPRLSPDGGAVAYTSFDKPDDSADGSGGHVHVFDLAAGVDRRIGGDPSSAYEIWPQFSPDGRQVLYQRYGVDAPMRLMIAAADGTGSARQVGPAQDADTDYIVAFSPDGTKLFVVRRGLSRWQLIDVADGSVQYGTSVDDWAHWQRVAAAE